MSDRDRVLYDRTTGQVIHEPGAEQGERLDDYLARRLPGRDWYALCHSNVVQVRDYFDPAAGTYTRERWYLTYPGGRVDLEPGERPRMRDGYCRIVREEVR